MKRRALTRVAGPSPVMDVAYEFGFEAAHRFTGMPRRHRYGGTHGHSFRAEIVLRGKPHPPHGFVADFARMEKTCLALRRRLDHALLNDVEGLETPSLENLCVWIWDRLAAKFPDLARVSVRRDSLGQSCTYRGPG